MWSTSQGHLRFCKGHQDVTWKKQLGEVARRDGGPGFVIFNRDSASGRGHFSAQCLQEKLDLEIDEGIGCKDGSRGCRAKALLVVDSC